MIIGYNKKDKAILRKEIIYKLKRQDKKEALEKSEIIKEKLFSMSKFKKAKVVMFYASLNGEVNTYSMIKEALQMGKRVALPSCCAEKKEIVPREIKDVDKDLEKGTYGIYEPVKGKKEVPLEEIELVVVPGVAFDENNNRLGRGKGYYDRFLRKIQNSIPSVGLAFDFQMVKDLPKNPRDIPVCKVITN